MGLRYALDRLAVVLAPFRSVRVFTLLSATFVCLGIVVAVVVGIAMVEARWKRTVEISEACLVRQE